MADPFSITTGAIALTQLCGIVVKELRDFRTAYNKFDKEIEGLSRAVSGLSSITHSVSSLWTQKGDHISKFDLDKRQQIEELWAQVGQVFQDCQDLIEELQDLVDEIKGPEDESSGMRAKYRKVRKVRKRESKQDEMNEMRKKIMEYQATIQLSLTALNLFHIQAFEHSFEQASEQISDRISQLVLELKQQRAAMGQHDAKEAEWLRALVSTAGNMAAAAKVNQHFYIPEKVISYFTGRKTDLDRLRVALDPTMPPSDCKQRRFIVYGLAGSGKTQFCCQLAESMREQFWGVFTLDASSMKTAEGSLREIASYGKVDPNPKAAKHWLTNARAPWLLIIDNADDPEMPIEDCFPAGQQGSILITTRNPRFKVHGTILSRSYNFERLDPSEAQNLLLRTADEINPSIMIRNAAMAISEEMQCLPLALVYAGQVIRERLCEWTSYLNFYKMRQRAFTVRPSKKVIPDELKNERVFLNFEMLFDKMQNNANGNGAGNPNSEKARKNRDAIELIQMFSFLHYRNIQVSMLLGAVDHPGIQERINLPQDPAQAKADEENVWRRAPLKHKIATVAQKIMATGGFKYMFEGKPALPDVLRNPDFRSKKRGARERAELRLRTGLNELTRRSLISDFGGDGDFHKGVFSMHPLIHLYIRDRLGKAWKEAAWCEVAQTVLTRCIVAEEKVFMGGTSSHFKPRELLPHLQYARKCQQEISDSLRENREAVNKASLDPGLGRGDAFRLAKYALVYSMCGDFENARLAYARVRDFVLGIYGINHPTSIRLTFVLALTHLQLSKFQQSVDLQREAMVASAVVHGPDKAPAIRMINALGMFLFFRGKLAESGEKFQMALDGFEKLFGRNHRDTLNAMSSLGSRKQNYFLWEESRKLCQEAVDGLFNIDPEAEETLAAKENLAMALTRLGGDDIEKAMVLEDEVLRKRIKLLGREHPYTLLSYLNRSRVLLFKGDYYEAERCLFGNGIGIRPLETAERNLGPMHFGTLATKTLLACIWWKQHQYSKADQLFNEVNESHKKVTDGYDIIEQTTIFTEGFEEIKYEQKTTFVEGTGHDHVDRIMHLYYWLQCLQEQGRYDEAMNIHDETLEACTNIDGSGLGLQHPMTKMLADKKQELLMQMEEQETLSAPPKGAVKRCNSIADAITEFHYFGQCHSG